MKNRVLTLLEKSILTTPRHRTITFGLPQQMLQQQHAAPISSSTGSLEKIKAKSKNSHHMEWRKKQLDLLEQKFHPHKTTAANYLTIHDEEDEDDHDHDGQQNSSETSTTMIVQREDANLQPMWKQMESRVKNRRTRSIEECEGRSGRENIKQTDEDEWLRAGLYNRGGGEGSTNGGAVKSDR